jgi:hypothetical protein
MESFHDRRVEDYCDATASDRLDSTRCGGHGIARQLGASVNPFGNTCGTTVPHQSGHAAHPSSRTWYTPTDGRHRGNARTSAPSAPGAAGVRGGRTPNKQAAGPDVPGRPAPERAGPNRADTTGPGPAGRPDSSKGRCRVPEPCAAGRLELPPTSRRPYRARPTRHRSIPGGAAAQVLRSLDASPVSSRGRVGPPNRGAVRCRGDPGRAGARSY